MKGEVAFTSTCRKGVFETYFLTVQAHILIQESKENLYVPTQILNLLSKTMYKNNIYFLQILKHVGG